MRCPNAGPGRYEGESAPCLAALLDQSIEDEAHGTVDAPMGHVRVYRPHGQEDLWATCVDALPDDPSDPCPWQGCDSCRAEADGATAALLTTDAHGFVSVRTFDATEGDAFAAAVAEVEAQAEAWHADG